MKNRFDLSSFGYQLRRRELQEERLKDFRLDSKDGYTYQGSYMTAELSDEAYLRILLPMLAAELLTLGLSIAAGCVTGTGMEGRFYLLLPYVGVLILSVLSLHALVWLLFCGTSLRSYVYKTTAGRLPATAFFGLVCALAGLIGLGYDCVRGAYVGSGVGQMLFAAALAAGLLGNLYVFLKRRSVKWREERQG